MLSTYTLVPLGLERISINTVNNSQTECWLRGIREGDPLPDAHDQSGDILFRLQNEKQLHVVSNGTRRPLNSMKELGQFPYLDIEKTVFLHDYFDLTIFFVG